MQCAIRLVRRCLAHVHSLGFLVEDLHRKCVSVDNETTVMEILYARCSRSLPAAHPLRLATPLAPKSTP